MSSSFHGVLSDGVQVLMKLSFTVVGLYIGITLQKSIILKTDYAFGAAFVSNKNLDRPPLVDPKEALSISRLLHNFKMSKINRLANGMACEDCKSFLGEDNRSDDVLLNSFSHRCV